MKSIMNYILRNGYYLLIIILLFVSFRLILRKHSYKQFSINSILSLYVKNIQNGINVLFNLRNLYEINQTILAENSVLKSKLAIFEKKSMKPLQENLNLKYISSSVIKNSYNKNNNYIIIDKGRRHGVEPCMGVISNKGVLGIVKDVSDNFCSVLSILNTYSKIDAKLKKNHFSGTILRITNDFKNVWLEDIPIHANLNIGDTIVTGGNSLIFPENIGIGTISDYSKDIDTYKIKVALSSDFTNIRYVYIIKNNLKKEFDNLLKE